LRFGFAVTINGDSHEHHHIKANFFSINHDAITLDHIVLFQLADFALGRRCGEANLTGEVLIGDACILLQLLEDFNISLA